MRADVAQGKGSAAGVASENQGNLEARGGQEVPAADQIAPQYRIPKPPQEFVPAWRGSRYGDRRGLLHYGVRPMIAAVMIYGPRVLPKWSACAACPREVCYAAGF